MTMDLKRVSALDNESNRQELISRPENGILIFVIVMPLFDVEMIFWTGNQLYRSPLGLIP